MFKLRGDEYVLSVRKCRYPLTIDKSSIPTNMINMKVRAYDMCDRIRRVTSFF